MSRNVLIPLDGTDEAEAAVSAVAKICGPDDRVMLLNVEDPDAPFVVGRKPGFDLTALSVGSTGINTNRDVSILGETTDQAAQAELNEARNYLEKVAAPLRQEGLLVQTEALLHEKPAEAIVDFARELKPDFIAMVRRTHGLAALFGSVTSDVINANVAPVLIVPSHQ